MGKHETYWRILQNTIFPKGIRPQYHPFNGTNPDTGGGFATYFHYPGQRFKSYYSMKFDWKERDDDTGDYKMRFAVRDIEVLNHRNKVNKPCIEDWRNYDQVVMDGIMRNVGCRPPHWDTTLKNLTLCSTAAEMKYFKDGPTTAEVQTVHQPCNVIENLHYDYLEKDSLAIQETVNDTFLTIMILYRQATFREIKQSQAYDVESLVGNMGGYMGLLLGYAILQLPNFCSFLFSVMKRAIKKLREGNTAEVVPMNSFGKHQSYSEDTSSLTPLTMSVVGPTNPAHLQVTYGSTEVENQNFAQILRTLEKRLKAIEDKLPAH